MSKRHIIRLQMLFTMAGNQEVLNNSIIDHSIQLDYFMQSVRYDGVIISFRRPFKCKSVITLVGVNLVSSRSKPNMKKGIYSVSSSHSLSAHALLRRR